jgi:hypothetical protein
LDNSLLQLSTVAFTVYNPSNTGCHVDSVADGMAVPFRYH